MSFPSFARSHAIRTSWLLALAAILWLPVSVAAENPSFTGEWVLVPEKSKNLGALTGSTQWLKFDAGSLTIARKVDFVEQEKPMEYEYVYVVDGEEHLVKDPTGLSGPEGKGQRQTKAEWTGWGGRKLEAEWSFYAKPFTIKVVETWRPKGKDLEIEREFSGAPVDIPGHKHYYKRAQPKGDDS